MKYMKLGDDLVFFGGQLYVERIIGDRVYYFVLCTDEQADKIWAAE